MNLDNIINRYQRLMQNYIITHGDNKDFIFNDFENMVRHIYGGSEGTETTPQQRQHSIFSISIFDLIKEIDKKLSQPILFLLDSKLYAHVTMLDFTMSNKDIKPQTVLRKQIFNESYKSQDDSILNELLNKNNVTLQNFIDSECTYPLNGIILKEPTPCKKKFIYRTCSIKSSTDSNYNITIGKTNFTVNKSNVLPYSQPFLNILDTKFKCLKKIKSKITLSDYKIKYKILNLLEQLANLCNLYYIKMFTWLNQPLPGLNSLTDTHNIIDNFFKIITCIDEKSILCFKNAISEDVEIDRDKPTILLLGAGPVGSMLSFLLASNKQISNFRIIVLDKNTNAGKRLFTRKKNLILNSQSMYRIDSKNTYFNLIYDIFNEDSAQISFIEIVFYYFSSALNVSYLFSENTKTDFDFLITNLNVQLVFDATGGRFEHEQITSAFRSNTNWIKPFFLKNDDYYFQIADNTMVEYIPDENMYNVVLPNGNILDFSTMYIFIYINPPDKQKLNTLRISINNKQKEGFSEDRPNLYISFKGINLDKLEGVVILPPLYNDYKYTAPEIQSAYEASYAGSQNDVDKLINKIRFDLKRNFSPLLDNIDIHLEDKVNVSIHFKSKFSAKISKGTKTFAYLYIGDSAISDFFIYGRGFSKWIYINQEIIKIIIESLQSPPSAFGGYNKYLKYKTKFIRALNLD